MTWGQAVVESPACDLDRENPRLPALTGARFVAATIVLLCHFMSARAIPTHWWLINSTDYGRSAVSFFFVLSGFVLAYGAPLERAPDYLRRFYLSRFARLYPVLLLSLVVSAAGVLSALRNPARLADWYAVHHNAGISLVGSLLAQLTMTVAWIPSKVVNQPWNSPAWSIACEVFFYALFPMTYTWLRRMSRVRLLCVLGSGFAAQGLWIAWVGTHISVERGLDLIRIFPLTHLFDFVLGIGAALLFAQGGRPWFAARRTLVLSASSIAIVAVCVTRPIYPEYYLLTPLFAALILGLATAPRTHRSILGSPLLVTLGEASYALYLLHLPILRAAQSAGLPKNLGWPLMIATVGISVGVYRNFEVPMRERIRSGAPSTSEARHPGGLQASPR